MAGPHACQSPCRNSPSTNDNELAGAASTKGNRILISTSVVLRVATPAPAPPLAFAKFVAKYTNADPQKTTKLALELFI